jgi:hypothetical protein
VFAVARLAVLEWLVASEGLVEFEEIVEFEGFVELKGVFVLLVLAPRVTLLLMRNCQLTAGIVRWSCLRMALVD